MRSQGIQWDSLRAVGRRTGLCSAWLYFYGSPATARADLPAIERLAGGDGNEVAVRAAAVVVHDPVLLAGANGRRGRAGASACLAVTPAT